VSLSDQDYLGYIAESIDRLERWTARGREALVSDEILREAVLHRLETLADAVSRLSDPQKQRHPAIPWRSVTDFRNRLAHGYLDVRPERVWDVITDDLPELRALVASELNTET
jgi:uncharacterized protein with HEPN domain